MPFKFNPFTSTLDVVVDSGFEDVKRYGFLNQTETGIAFSDSTYTFTLSDTGSGWSYWRAGIKYTITGNKTVVIASPPVDATAYYIYIDSTTGTLVSSTSPWTLNDTKVPVAFIYWNSTLTPKYQMADERHTVLIDRRMHYYEHLTEGTKSITAGALGGYTPNTDTNVAKTVSIATSTIADEDIIHSLAALSDPDGTTTAYTVFYRTGASSWAWKSSNMPFVYNVGNTNDWIQWDNGGTMTDATGGGGALTRWVNSYLLFTNFSGGARYCFIPGQAIFSTLAAAQAEAPSSFTWTGFPIQEAVIAYRLTWTTITSTSQGKCRLAANPQSINLSAISTIGLGSTLDHNTLAGLNGGTTSQYYHLTSAEYTALQAQFNQRYTFMLSR